MNQASPCGHLRKYLGLIEVAPLIGRLLAAYTEQPVARKHDLLVRVIDVVLCLRSDCGDDRLLLSHQLDEHDRIGRQIARPGIMLKCGSLWQRFPEALFRNGESRRFNISNLPQCRCERVIGEEQ